MSRQFRRHVHLAFKIPKARFTATLAGNETLLNFFCSWDKFELLGSGFTIQVFAGYAPSPIRRGLIFYSSIASFGSVSKMILRLEYTIPNLLEYGHHGYCRDSLLLYQ